MSPHPQTTQPSGQPHMSLGNNLETKFMEGAAKEGGKQTVKYVAESDQGQQQLDEAKAQAQGLWQKYCGCFASAV